MAMNSEERGHLYTVPHPQGSLPGSLILFIASLSSGLPRRQSSAFSLAFSSLKEQISPQMLTDDLCRQHPSPSQKPSLLLPGPWRQPPPWAPASFLCPSSVVLALWSTVCSCCVGSPTEFGIKSNLLMWHPRSSAGR